MATTFIYALCEPGTRVIRYIGKSDDPKRRLIAHLATSKTFKSHLGTWLRSLEEPPALRILKEVPESDWADEEIVCIEFARALGLDLVNGTDGGEGAVNPSLETRAKLSAATRGDKNPMFGRTGEKCPHFGKPKAPETRAKLRAVNLGKHHTPEVRAKMSAARLGVKTHRSQTPEHKAKLLASNLGKIHTPETRAKMSAARRGENNPQFGLTGEKSPNFGKTHTPETLEKMRKAWEKRRSACAPIL